MLLAAASAGVFLHAGIKFPWFVFFQKDSGLRPPDPPLSMRSAMLLFAALCIGLGVWHRAALCAAAVSGRRTCPTRRAHVVCPAAAAAVLRPGLLRDAAAGCKRTLTITLDTDWLWRRLGPEVLARLDRGADDIWRWLTAGIASAARLLNASLHRHHGPDGVFGRTWPTGTMALWATVMLGAYLVLSYVGGPFR